MAKTSRVTPEYWDDACKHLAKRDRVMRKLIPQFGEARLQSRGDAFTTLARSIVGQQISVKAAQSVWDKLVLLLGTPATRIEPLAVHSRLASQLREAGLSLRKAEYLLDLARHFDSGQVHVDEWQRMPDEAIIEELVAIRGIGRWTAEMFLIFRLQRLDVLPVGDLGIQNAIQKAYRLRKKPSPERMRKLAAVWQPYRSIACWYLWRSLDSPSPGLKPGLPPSPRLRRTSRRSKLAKMTTKEKRST
jgi:DNA-3-methyladenine glycosylase II